jgi:hypothetical protein
MQCKKAPRVLSLDYATWMHYGEDFDISPDTDAEPRIDLSKVKGLKELHLEFVGSHVLHKLPEGLEKIIAENIYCSTKKNAIAGLEVD